MSEEQLRRSVQSLRDREPEFIPDAQRVREQAQRIQGRRNRNRFAALGLVAVVAVAAGTSVLADQDGSGAQVASETNGSASLNTSSGPSEPASEAPGSTQTTGANARPACNSTKSNSVPAQDRVYFFCGLDLKAVARPTENRQDRIGTIRSALLSGPTGDELARGFISTFALPNDGFDVSRVGEQVRVALTIPKADVQSFLATANFTQDLLTRNYAQLPGITTVSVTVNGQSLCEADEECSQP